MILAMAELELFTRGKEPRNLHRCKAIIERPWTEKQRQGAIRICDDRNG
jgi:hypothetical protein